jgi:hypothetical protein
MLLLESNFRMRRCTYVRFVLVVFDSRLGALEKEADGCYCFCERKNTYNYTDLVNNAYFIQINDHAKLQRNAG